MISMQGDTIVVNDLLHIAYVCLRGKNSSIQKTNVIEYLVKFQHKMKTAIVCH